MSKLRSRLWRDGVVVAENFPLDDLDTHLETPGDLVWFDVCAPEAADLAEIAREMKFDPHAVEDATAPSERAKAQRFASHTFVSVYAAALNPELADDVYDSRLEVHRVSAFVLPQGIVTVRRDEGFDIDAAVRVWDDNPDLVRRAGAGALLHGLLDVVVDGHFTTIQQLDDRIEGIENRLFDESIKARKVQEEVYRLRKELVELRRVVLPMREIVATIQRHQVEDRSDARVMDAWWQDLTDHVLRASEWTESLRDMITSLFETNLSLQDARLNMVMKRLAGWGAVFAVPTAVTGWFGQNVPYPGFSNHAGYILSAILTFGGSIGMYLLLKRVDWI